MLSSKVASLGVHDNLYEPHLGLTSHKKALNPLELTLHNRASEIPLAHQALDEFVAKQVLPVRDLPRLHVAIEEHLANIISHGYSPQQSGTIQLRLSVVSSGLRVEIEDDASPFNPLEAPEVDTSVPLEQKPLGGLGVLLIRKSVDKLSYIRKDQRNLLTMIQRLADSKAA